MAHQRKIIPCYGKRTGSIYNSNLHYCSFCNTYGCWQINGESISHRLLNLVTEDKTDCLQIVVRMFRFWSSVRVWGFLLLFCCCWIETQNAWVCITSQWQSFGLHHSLWLHKLFLRDKGLYQVVKRNNRQRKCGILCSLSGSYLYFGCLLEYVYKL